MSPDTLTALATHVARAWGDYGYSIHDLRNDYATGAGAVLVCAADGSRFTVATDRHASTFVDVDGHRPEVAFARLADKLEERAAVLANPPTADELRRALEGR